MSRQRAPSHNYPYTPSFSVTIHTSEQLQDWPSYASAHNSAQSSPAFASLGVHQLRVACKSPSELQLGSSSRQWAPPPDIPARGMHQASGGDCQH